MASIEFAERVAEFVAFKKDAANRYRWRKKNDDWVQASFGLADAMDSGKILDASIVMQVHVSRDPPKYSFVMLYRNQRVVALDVGPGRTHTNPHTLEIVRCTHWHGFPSDIAEPDDREQGHDRWFREFLLRCNATYRYRYVSPPVYFNQLELPI